MANDITIKFKSTGLTQLQKDLQSIDTQIKDLLRSGNRIEIGSGLPATSKAAQGLANALHQAGIDTARFGSNLDKLEGKLQGASRQASRFGDVVTGIGQGIGQGIFDTLAGSVSGVGSAIATNTLQFEKFNTVLTTTLGSQQLAAAAFQKIQKFAATTPFQLDEVLGSFIKLQNRGIEPTNQLLTSLGDLASSQGKSLDQVTEALLDAQTGEFERLKEFGIQASSAGDRVTLSFKGVTQTVAKTPEAISKVIAGFGQLEGVAGGMEAQSKTLGGQLSNLQDSATAASVAFGSALAPSLQKVVESINSNSGSIGEFAGEIGGNLAIAFDKVIQLGSEVSAAFTDIVEANPELKDLGESVQNFLGVAFDVSLDAVRRFIQGLKTVTSTQAFGVFVQVVTGGLNAITKSFDIANQVLNALFDGISAAIGTIDGAINTALDNNALRVFTAGIAGSIDLLTVSLANAEDVLARLNLAKSKQAGTGLDGLGDVAGQIEKDATKTIEIEAKKQTKVKKESAGDQEKLAKEAADREKKIIEDLTQASSDANDEILRNERDRLTQIDQLQARGVRNGGISAAQAEKMKADEAGKRIKQQLAEEAALRAELASKSFSDPKLEEQRQQQIRSSIKKTADLQDAATQNELKQQQALIKVVQEKIDKQFNQAKNSLTAQSQQLERQNNLLSTQTSLLDGQQRLLQSRANLQRAISDFQKSQFSIALDLLDSQFAAEDKLQQQQKSRADILKRIDDTSASDDDRRAAREELAQLDRQIEREQLKDQLRLEAAKAEFQQKLVAQELERKSVELEQKKTLLLLQQEIIRNRIAEIEAQIATNQSQADLAKAKADPTTTPEALRSLELSVSANQEKQKLVAEQGNLLQQQVTDQKVLNEEQKKRTPTEAARRVDPDTSQRRQTHTQHPRRSGVGAICSGGCQTIEIYQFRHTNDRPNATASHHSRRAYPCSNCAGWR
ncbi:MAG: hypothetical protein HC772_16590 [Leptolyngbyaceae cyanobacterium CRU_2_3]|nr:hypothetical protein [Leptolyngbyaceae cyanobacterium CRU_2_3]